MRGNRESQLPAIIADIKAVCGPSMKASMSRLEAEIAKLTDELEILRGVKADAPIKNEWRQYGLQSGEIRILEALIHAGPKGLRHEALFAATRADGDVNDWPSVEILKVRMCHLRKKLRDAGVPVWIETVWGEGYIFHDGPAPKRIASTKSHYRYREPAMTWTAIRDRAKRQERAHAA